MGPARYASILSEAETFQSGLALRVDQANNAIHLSLGDCSDKQILMTKPFSLEEQIISLAHLD
jgi:hypothetical protein